MYNVLWIDDQCKDQELKQFIIKAYNNGIKLDGYQSYEEGFEVLEKNIETYDAILLDGMFFEKKGQQKGTEDESGLGMAIAKINELKSKKTFPWFVLSGKESFTTSENLILKVNKVPCFDKSKSSDIEELFKQIKLAADNQKDRQIRHNYQRVFEVCTEEYVGDHVGQDLLNLLKIEDAHDSVNHLNAIRKILDDLFIAFNKFKLLPDEFVKPTVALNPSSIFLSGYQSNRLSDINKQFKHFEETHLPRQISEYIRSILSVTQSGSHRSDIDKHVQKVQTPYLFKSTLYQLMDLLVWFKMYVDANPKPNNWKKAGSGSRKPIIIKKNINEIKWLFGKIISISDNNKGVFEAIVSLDKFPIPSDLIVKHNLKLNESVKVKVVPTTDGKERHVKDVSRDLL